MTEQVDDFLMHYGVKGMRWGRKRSSESNETGSKMSQRTKKNLIIGATAAGVVGMAIAMKTLDKHGDVSLSKISEAVETRMGKRMTSKEYDALDPNRFGQNRKFTPPTTPPTVNVGPKATTPPKATSLPKTTPAGTKPKAPSPYPMTPVIPTPILDEINRRYGW